MIDQGGTDQLGPRDKFPEYFSLLDLCFKLSDTIIHSLETKGYDSIQEMGEYKLITAASLYKATESVHSIFLLLSDRLVGDAMVVCRRIIELDISLKYLQMDPEIRSKQYWNYLRLASKKLLNIVDNEAGYSNTFRANLEKMRSDIDAGLEKVKGVYELDKSGNIKKCYFDSWSGKTTEQMAKKAEIAEDYLYPYRYFSKSTHSSVEDMLNYFDADTNALGPNFSNSTILQLILQTTRAHLIIMEIVEVSHELGLAGSISIVRNTLNGLRDDPRYL